MFYKLLLVATIATSVSCEKVAGASPNLSAVVKKCNGELGECVPFHLCKKETINPDGSGLLNVRNGDKEQCLDTFERCCTKTDIQVSTRWTPASPLKPIQTQCGFRNIDGVGFKITGNTNGETEFGEFPWMVAVLKEEKLNGKTKRNYECGGSLIHPSVVLTTAECIQGKVPASLTVVAGEWDSQSTNEHFPHVDRVVSSFVIHKDFYGGGLYNNIALLFLKSDIKADQHINTICLPPQGTVFDNSRCFATGWGKDKFGKEGTAQNILRKIEVPIVASAKCQESLRKTKLGKTYNLHSSFMCAGGEPGKDTCKGDGGSPLVCPIKDKSGHYYQAGITSYGVGCSETGTPGVYVNVAKFRNWIDEQLRLKNLQTNTYTI